MPGLPEPPPLGATVLPEGTFESVPVLITGAGTGLGKAIAVEFARLGASVVIASRKQEHLDAGAAAVQEVGGTVLTVVGATSASPSRWRPHSTRLRTPSAFRPC